MKKLYVNVLLLITVIGSFLVMAIKRNKTRQALEMHYVIFDKRQCREMLTLGWYKDDPFFVLEILIIFRERN